ncbi:MAG: hypothetical protein RL166_852 [Actinomycetota bacterium]|jgi:hypothetical protein
MGKAITAFTVLATTATVLMTAGCATLPWNYESTSKELLKTIASELAPTYQLVNLEKGCGLGIDCNDANYHAVFSRDLTDKDSNIECLQIIDYARGLGLTTWFDPDDSSKKFSLEDDRELSINTCLKNIADIPKFKENTGFAEADSKSISFKGEVDSDGKPAAPLEIDFRISRQREDGETGDGDSSYVLLVSTRFGQQDY